MKTNLRRFLSFILIGGLLFCLFFRIFHFKYAKPLEQYHTLPKQSVDVLFIGSSHAYRSINPAVLYEQNGISAYVLGTAGQALWNTYYYLKEALITQSPEVVFIECYRATIGSEYTNSATAIKATSGFHFSRNYLEAVYHSIKDKNMFLDYALQFPWFHSRYKEIDWSSDIMPYYGNPGFYKDFLGFSYLIKPVHVKLETDIGINTERSTLSEKNLDYLNRIIALSEEKHFHLVFLITPFSKSAASKQSYFNSLEDFLSEKGYPLINFNLLYEELGLNPETDFGKGDHLTLQGADKVASYLCHYLEKHYHLPDHRNDKQYERWERNLEIIRKARNGANIEDIETDN